MSSESAIMVFITLNLTFPDVLIKVEGNFEMRCSQGLNLSDTKHKVKYPHNKTSALPQCFNHKGSSKR